MPNIELPNIHRLILLDVESIEEMLGQTMGHLDYIGELDSEELQELSQAYDTIREAITYAKHIKMLIDGRHEED